MICRDHARSARAARPLPRRLRARAAFTPAYVTRTSRRKLYIHRYCTVRSRDDSWLGNCVCLGEVLCFCHRWNDDGLVTENECNDRINDAVNEISPFLKITRAISSGAAAGRAAQAESRRRAGGHVASQKSYTFTGSFSSTRTGFARHEKPARVGAASRRAPLSPMPRPARHRIYY